MTKLKPVLLPALLALVLAIAYYPTLGWLCERYRDPDSYYSHGFLVPLLVGYLLWAGRARFRAEPLQYSPSGLVLVIGALFLHLFSTLAGVYFLSAYSLLPLVFGLSLYFFGPSITRKAAFPLLFLVFMLPLPLAAINALSFPMRMYATKASVFILDHVSPVMVQQEGFKIILPNGSLTVESPCSGLRSLISMLMLGSVFGYLMPGRTLRRVLLPVLAIPIALVSNVFRIVTLCVGFYFMGSEGIHGTYHDVTGYSMFLAAFVALWCTRKSLLRKPKHPWDRKVL